MAADCMNCGATLIRHREGDYAGCVTCDSLAVTAEDERACEVCEAQALAERQVRRDNTAIKCGRCSEPINIDDDVYILSAAYVTDTHDWDYERAQDVAIWCYACGQAVEWDSG